MADILVIGMSGVFLKRVLPALLDLPMIDKIHLASRERPQVDRIPAARLGECIQGYERALEVISPCLTYISLPNGLHFLWAKRALERGFHVVVDKPAFCTLAETEELLSLARSRNLCLAEATVWPFFPQVDATLEFFRKQQCVPTILQAVFCFPALQSSNFRCNPLLGGGSFMDLGPYAVSPGRVFYDEMPASIDFEITDRDATLGIDTGFVFNARYSMGRSFQGVFKFGAEYQNRMVIIGRSAAVTLEPVFTAISPAAELHANVSSKSTIIEIEKADAFMIFFKEVLFAIDDGDFSKWYSRIQYDAKVMDLALNSTGATNVD